MADQNMTATAFRNAIRNYLKEQGITPYALAKQAGIDNKTIYMILAEPEDNAEQKPSLENIRRLSTVLGISAITLFLKAYPQFSDDLTIEPDELEIVLRYREMPVEVQKAIHRILGVNSLVQE